ncbi:hypothetical protein ACTMTJ_39340 [Phytohabitans sp. LJ34]|uniref:hypothetical protein n=1 Tax=Phytohabitans sp. LJ34 TaxID=3452217 RepID=UPI003F89C012
MTTIPDPPSTTDEFCMCSADVYVEWPDLDQPGITVHAVTCSGCGHRDLSYNEGGFYEPPTDAIYHTDPGWEVPDDHA